MTHAALGLLASAVLVRTRRAGLLAVALAAALHVVVAGQQAGTNVNIVKGTSLPGGDPFLQRQTEPSVAISTRNPCHLVASAVDYRTVDLEHADDVNPTQLASGDAWLGFYKSFDCGQRWQSHLIPGYAGDKSADGMASPLHGFEAGADGVVRAGSNGLFYYVGMVFQRDQSASKVFVSRFIDSNNKERGDTIEFAGTSVVASGDTQHFLDKPWIAVDIPRKALTVTTRGRDDEHGRDDDRDHDGVCVVNGQRVAAGNVYVGWTNFDVTTTTETSRIMFARSATCGRTWQQRPIFEHRHARPAHRHESHRGDRDFDSEDEDNEASRVVQGTAIAIAPADGAVYVAWRQFARNGLPSGIFVAKSTDGGSSFSAPQQLALINGFDQERGLTTFRTNAMPTIAADQAGRVYVAWAERGYASMPGRGDKLTGDSRIMLSVSPDRGRTWLPRYAIDNSYIDDAGVRRPVAGHQLMPSLSVAAGKLHVIWYDFRSDPCLVDSAKAMQPSCGSINGVPNYEYIDGIDHLVTVQSATAAIGAQPAFTSVRMSQFPRSIEADGKVHEKTSHANLPLYSAGTKSFLGDYIDAAALVAVPTRSGKNVQEWVPNTGLVTAPSGKLDPSAAPMGGFTTLPIFQGVWTDTRDVRPPQNGDWTLYYPPRRPSTPLAACNPDTAGMRDANIYSSRLTPGVYVGSPSNAKPLGFVTRDGVRQHLQRAFVVFIQNPLRETRYYRLTIVNQPGAANTDRASFNQFPSPPFKATNPSDKLHDPRIPPVITAWVAAPPISTVSRNVYVTAADPTAQVRVDVEETDAPLATPAPVPGQPAPKAAVPPLKANGLRSSILLNPDPTSPALVGPDLVGNVPDIAELEVHEPVVDDPIFFNVNDPRTRSTALRTPADQNPADQNPADQNPADQNITDLNPADQNPADQNPADQNPADQNPAVEAVAFGDDVTGAGTLIRDVHFPVRNNGNTTTRYFFRPVVKSTSPDRKYQLLVTVRNNTLTVDDACNLKIDPQREVLVNVSNFRPRTPADQNPADQNPADQNPADQNPADQNPADQNPADQNPADQNTSFFLAPGDEATVTLRIYAPSSEFATLPSPANDQVAAVVASASANTGETVAPTAAAGADLTVNEPPAVLNVEFAEPGQQVDLSWTLKNRGTSPASSTNGSITTQFYLSTNGTAAFTPGDVLLASTSREGDIPACTATTPIGCAFDFIQRLTIPATTVPSATPYFIKVITDTPSGDFPTGRVFEADETNNVALVPVTVAVINDAPTFTTGPNQSLLRSAGAQTVEAWATGISAGPADEAAQAVNFVVSTDNTSLFSVQPAITPAGTLTFTPATAATGSATVTVRLHDSGGTLFGGVDTSAPQTFVISVTAVNDAPSFVRGGDQTSLEDAGTVSVSNWATNASAGPADEAGQLVDFRVSADNAALFAIAPAVTPSGTLTYTPAPNANGIASVTVQLHDNGGTANGGVDTSTAQTFTISVTAVNDAPSFTRGADQTVPAGAGPQTVPDWATGISAGPQDEAGQALEFLVVAENPTLFSTPPAVSPAGTLTYTPLPDATGSTVVTVRLHDDGGTANGGVDTSAPQTFTITLAASAPTASSDNFATFEDVPLPVSACTAPIDYAGFSANSPFLTLAGDAAFTATDADGSVLRLISALTPEGAFNFGARGGAWTRPPLSLANFHTTFTFRMSGGAAPFAPDPSTGWDGQGLGPDGLVFVLQNAAAGVNALGGSGGALVSGITPSVGIEFDTFQSTEFADPDSNHIGIDINGSNVSVVTTNVATRFDDGSLWTAWVDYDGTTLEVRASPDGVRPDAPNLAYPINLPAILGPSATAGFVAANGSNVANGDLVSWSSTCTTPSLLSNDTDPNGRPLTASLVTQASNGIATVNADGTFSYTPEPNFFGGDSFTYKANNGTTDSAPAVVTVIVNAVNDPPSFVKGPDQTAVADGLPRTISPWATAISAGPANESQSVFFVVSNDNNALFATQPAVEANTGTLSFTPNAGASGTAVVTVEARDNGGTATGGINSSAPQTFTITVTAVVNRTPTAVNDTATTTENSAATIAVLANDSDPDGDPLSVTGVSEPSFGTAVVNADNTITYTPAFEFSGADSFSYFISDGRGGAANATVTIAVVAVNDAPTFIKGADQTVAEDAGAQAVPSWATNITAGDSDDAGQVVNFVTSNDNAALFSVQPAIDPDGTLRFTSASNAYGTATVTVRLHDDGGTANGGVDTSAPQVFTITVTPVNDPPVANADTAFAIAGVPTSINVLANDADVDEPAGSVVAAVPIMPAGVTTNIAFPSQVATVNGQTFFANFQYVAAFDWSAGTASAATPWPTPGDSGLTAVNRASGFIYWRQGRTIQAYDSHTRSIVASLRIGGNVQRLDLDESRGILYVTHNVSLPNGGQGAVIAIDVQPGRETFHQVLGAVALPNGARAFGIAVNPTTNRIYVASGAGIFEIDGDTRAVARIPGSIGASEIAVDASAGGNLVYASRLVDPNSSQIEIIDPTSPTPVTLVSVPGFAASFSAGTFVFTTHIAVNATTHRAYVRSVNPTPPFAGVVAVVDGNRGSASFRNVLATIPIGIDESTDAIVVDEGANRVVVTSGDDFRVVVIDGATNAATTLQTGEYVGPIALDSSTHRATVTGLMSLLDVSIAGTPAIVRSVPVGTVTGNVVVDRTSHRAYATNRNGTATASVLDPSGAAGVVSGLQSVGRYPFAAVNPLTHRLYLLNSDANVSGTAVALPGFVAVIDTTTNAVIANVPIQGYLGTGLGLETTTNTVYASAFAPDFLGRSVIVAIDSSNHATPVDTSAFDDFDSFGGTFVANTATKRVYFRVDSGVGTSAGMIDATTNIATPLPGDFGSLVAIAANPALNRVYFVNTAGQLFVLDGATHVVLASLSVGSPGPILGMQQYLAVDTANGRVFVIDFTRNAVAVIDGITNAVLGMVPSGRGPVAVDVDERTHRAYVGSITERTVTIVDGAAATAVGSIAVPFSPVSLAVDSAADPAQARLYSASGSGPDAGIAVILDGGYPATLHVNSVTQGGQGAVAIGPDGAVTYSPAAAAIGVDSFSYTITDGEATSAPATVTVTITRPLTITTTTLATSTVEANYDQTLDATGGTAPYAWTIVAGTLPAGTVLSGNGRIQGQTTGAGVFTFTVQVIDSAMPAHSAQATLNLVVNGPALQITTSALRDAVIIENYGNNLVTSGGVGTKAFSVQSGSLPPGITLNGNGSLSGTATRTGTFAFVVKAVDCAASSCAPAQTPQSATRALTLRVDAREQQTGGPQQPAISFGGAGGRKFAQTVTVGAQGTLVGVGVNFVSCPAGGPVTVAIQRLTLAGLPDGNTIATGTAANAFFAMSVSPAIDFPIGARFAFVLSSPTLCDIANAVAIDNYQGGDAYVDAGTGWQPLALTDNRFDLPFRTLIQPALPVAYLSRSRGAFTATVLSDGRVLLAGNDATADLYDPQTNTTTLTGSMSQPRSEATGTVLAGGKVLIAGGFDFTGNATATTDIYDPASGTFTPGPVMSVARRNHRATALADGRVLITGGNTSDDSALQSAEIYDPAQPGFTTVGNMVTARTFHTSTLLQTGKVLVAAGYNNTITAAELFDPITNTFSPTSGSMVVPFRGRATATLLLNGQVLIAGGQPNDITSSAEIYDPTADAFSATGAMSTPRFAHTATPLADGSVLIAGGADQTQVQSYIPPLATLERYVPESGTFVPAGGLEAVRDNHIAALLNDGRVLFAGGFSQSFMTGNAAEIYDRATVPFLTTTTLPDAPLAVSYPSTTLVAGGGSGGPYQILNFGGLPPGISYDPNTFTLSGVPTQTGVFALGFKVLDNQAHSGVETLTLRVGSINRITSPYRLVDAALNRPYDVQLTATGTMPIVWSLVPASQFNPLPAGLTLNADGRITGAPTAFGYYNFGVRAVDATGQQATKTLAIFVRDALQIATASALDDGTLFDFYFACLNSFQGTGFHTWTVTSGTLPRGVTLQPFGCLAGQVTSLGAFTFTAQVTDESSPPQIESRTFTIGVSTAIDQGSGGDNNQPPLSFGGPVRIAQHVTTGISGPLNAFRVFGVSCPVGATITGEIQGLTPSGAPDGTVLAAGTAVSRFSNETITIGLSNPLRYAADSAFAFVLSADQTCDVHPAAFDTYGGGDAFVSTSTTWRSLREIDGRHDLPFETVITPPALGYTTDFRAAHSATVLQDGRVLIAGGSSSNSAEIYDPVTRLSTPTAGSMSVARRDHVATLLDDGTVLMTGGWNTDSNTYLSSAELFHPSTGMFELLASAMSVARTTHTATKLGDGRVLIAGGQSGVCCSTDLAAAELYNPASRTFTTIAPMREQRRDPTATLLLDGRVLIAGGYGTGFGNAEIFDPATSTFAFPIQMPVRAQHTATRLIDGRVLLAGGAGELGNPVTTALVFDPALGRFTPTGPMATPHVSTTATALADGSVLVAGGATENACCDSYPPHPTMERYVPAANSWVGAGSLLVNRYFHTASRLSDGTVLFAGTFGYSVTGSRSFEIYDRATAVSLVDATPPSGRTGEPYPGFSFAGQGGSGGPYSITQTGGVLPPGLVYDSETHDLSGTPTASGTYTPVFTVADTVGDANSQTVVIAIDPLAITTSAVLAEATFGVPYTATLTATGIGASTWTLVSGILPPGLTLVGNRITGTPTVSCCFYGFTVRAVDAAGQIATLALGINVNGAFAINPAAFAEASVLEPYDACVTTNAADPATFSVIAGSLPPGIATTGGACFSGTPTATGTYSFTVRATREVPPTSATASFTIRVSARDVQALTTQPGEPVSFGLGRRLAQSVVASANGALAAVGLPTLACTIGTEVNVDIQGVTPDGHPNGVTVATGAATFGYASIAVAPLLPMTIGQRFAFIVSASDTCAITTPVRTFDAYVSGDAYRNAGAEWFALKDSDGVLDLPFRTLVQPATELTYVNSGSRSIPVAVRLNDGRLLMLQAASPGVGGNNQVVDPIARTSVPAGSFALSRVGFTATGLSDGRVLIVGGVLVDSQFSVTASAEIYDPTTNSFTLLPNSLAFARNGHAATRLADGRVLITGGSTFGAGGTGFEFVLSAEIFDPVTLSFSSAGITTYSHTLHFAILLTDGTVLLGAGNTDVPESTEVYDPVAGTFTPTARPMTEPRLYTSAVSLRDGRALIAGGYADIPLAQAQSIDTAELYDPATRAFSAAGRLSVRRAVPAAELLVDGSAIVVGGYDTFTSTIQSSIDRFEPSTATFANGGSMVTSRYFTNAARLPDGRVAIIGGFGPSWLSSNSVELYDAAAPRLTINALPDGELNVPFPPTVLSATGGSGGPYQIQIVSGSLPAGMSFDSTTFTVAGTPVVPGNFTIGVRVADVTGRASVQPVTLSVSALRITTSELATAAQGQPYSQQLTATGVGSITWSVWSGALPDGLTLSAAGVISGTPTGANSFFASFEVRAVDSTGQVANRFLFISVQPPLTITTTTLPDAIATEFYSGGCLQTNGANFGVIWSVADGALPSGLTLSPFGCFDGTVDAFGTFTFTARVSDFSTPPQTASATFTVTATLAPDQRSSWDYSPQGVSFGGSAAGAGGTALGQRIIAGVNGALSAIRVQALSCPVGTNVTAQIQGVTASGLPNGIVLAAGSAPFTSTFRSPLVISLSPPLQMAAASSFALVLNADGAQCDAGASLFDVYPTDGFIFTGEWQRLDAVTGHNDLPFETLVAPRPGLTLTHESDAGRVPARLADGRVLIVGFDHGEIYDPATRLTTLVGALNETRLDARAVSLSDGSVLVVGGVYYDPVTNLAKVRNTAELFHPDTGSFELLGSTMSSPRVRPMMVALPGGRALIAGGYYFDDAGMYHGDDSADVFDAATRAFTPVGPMHAVRDSGAATLLEDGRVLLTGGSGASTFADLAEIFDPATGFTVTSHPMNSFRGRHTATRLRDGRVLLVGGAGNQRAAELYDPATDTFTLAEESQSRSDHTATLLPDGSVLIAGGVDESQCCTSLSSFPLSTMERYVPGLGFRGAGAMIAARSSHGAVALSDGSVLLGGGFGWSTLASRSLETYDPASAVALRETVPPVASTGVPYTFTLSGDGGSAPYQFAQLFGELPPGLSFFAASATIAGTPTAGGDYPVAFSIADMAGHTNTETLTFRVDSLVITSTSPLPAARAGGSYSHQLTATGVAPISWSVDSGSLPASLTLSPDGLISGTAQTPGFYFFGVVARDAANRVTAAFFSLQVEAPLTVTATTLPDAIAPQFYFGCLQSSGGSFPLSWTTTGMLPPDVTLTQFGCFEGPVVKTGTYTFSATVSDPAQPAASTPLTIRSGTIEQAQWSIDETSPFTTVAFGGPIAAAQVFTPQVNGNLLSMQLPVACTSGVLTLEIRGTTNGEPNGTVYSSEQFGIGELTAFQAGSAYHRQLRLSTAAFVARGTPIAAVLSSTGTCEIVAAAADSGFAQFSYPFGDGFTGSTGAWVRLAADRPDLPFQAVIDDGGRFALVTDSGLNYGSATLLDSGLVLVMGGYAQSSGLYNPTATPLPVGDSVDPPRFVNPGRFERLPDFSAAVPWQTATKLHDGRVLIAGGIDPATQLATNTARIYDPSTATFSDPIPMRSARMTHTATLLSSGDVLLVGGHAVDFFTPGLAVTEIFHYAPLTHTGTFVDGPTLNAGRAEAAAVLLANDGGPDRVLVTGGWGVPDAYSAEIIVGASSVTVAAPLQANRVVHTMTLLECATGTPCAYGGLVLVAGGVRPDNSGMVSTAELFDPANNQFTTVATTSPRSGHTATRTNSGAVLIAGGTSDRNGTIATTEMFSPASRSFVAASDLIVPRQGASAVHLPADTVLIVGGFGPSVASYGTLEIFNPLTDSGAVGRVNEPFTMTIPAAGATPLSFTIRRGSLPDGLTLDTSNGVISGTPTSPIVARLVVEVSDSSVPPRHTVREVTITIRPVTVVQQDNGPPIAADDPVTGSADSQTIVTVLANDSDPDHDPLTVTTVSTPLFGSAVLNPNDTIAYTPNAGFAGTDSFTYAITDGRGGTAVGHVTVTVTPPAARSNNAGPGAAIVSFFNPASTGNPASVPGFGTLTAVSFFNPAAVQTFEPAPVQSAAAFAVSFVNGPNPASAQTPTPSSAAAPSVSFVNGVNPTPATATPTASNATAPSVSFVNGANPTPTAATPTASSAVAASVSFVNGANPTPSGATPTASSTAAASVSFVNGANPATPGATPTASSAAAPSVSFVNGANPDLSGAVGGNVADSRVAVVTVAAGPTITNVSPTAVSITSASPELVLTGGNLANVTTVAFDDPTGILIGAIAPSTDGHTLTIQLLLQPATPPRTVMIAVSGPDGSSVVSSSTVFTLVP